MKSLAVISSMVVGALSTGFEEQIMKDLFVQWKQTHNKVYNGLEEEYRFNTFTQNYLDILEFNAHQDDVTLALNHFGDLTSEEFGTLYTGFAGSSDPVEDYHVIDAQDPPANVDWRTKGAVTPVKNQGSCGSCWAFSSTGALEGLYFIDGNTLTSFSEQNLVDCVTADQGCNGGLMSDAFTYTAQSKGIETEADYPYKGVDGTCAFQQSKAIQVNSGYYNVTPQNVTQLKLAVAQQPVSVAIQANQLVFQFYAGGVIKKFCGDSLDHGVLAVGYGLIKGFDAFIVKNSWGGSWGAEGYVYISTDADANKGNGVCGILSVPAYPIKQ